MITLLKAYIFFFFRSLIENCARDPTPEAAFGKGGLVELRLQSLTSKFWHRRGDPHANGYT